MSEIFDTIDEVDLQRGVVISPPFRERIDAKNELLGVTFRHLTVVPDTEIRLEAEPVVEGKLDSFQGTLHWQERNAQPDSAMISWAIGLYEAILRAHESTNARLTQYNGAIQGVLTQLLSLGGYQELPDPVRSFTDQLDLRRIAAEAFALSDASPLSAEPYRKQELPSATLPSDVQSQADSVVETVQRSELLDEAIRTQYGIIDSAKTIMRLVDDNPLPKDSDSLKAHLDKLKTLESELEAALGKAD